MIGESAYGERQAINVVIAAGEGDCAIRGFREAEDASDVAAVGWDVAASLGPGEQLFWRTAKQSVF